MKIEGEVLQDDKYYLAVFSVTSLNFIKFLSKMGARSKYLINFIHAKICKNYKV